MVYLIRRQVMRGIHSGRRTVTEYYCGADKPKERRWSEDRLDAYPYSATSAEGALPILRHYNQKQFGDECLSTVKVPL